MLTVPLRTDIQPLLPLRSALPIVVSDNCGERTPRLRLPLGGDNRDTVMLCNAIDTKGALDAKLLKEMQEKAEQARTIQGKVTVCRIIRSGQH
jgi:hypothetical protein